MNERSTRFLRSALGPQGAQALIAAASGALAPAALPRAAMAWVSVASEHGWCGPVPGVPEARLELAKGEAEGSLVWDGHDYRFDTLEKGAAAVALAAGYDPSVPIEASAEALARLGRGVEALARGRFEAALEKADDWYRRFSKEDRRVHLKKDGKRVCDKPMFSGDKVTEDPEKATCPDCKETKKAEAGGPEQGQVAKPKDPGKPTAPAAPTTGAKPPVASAEAQGSRAGTQTKPASAKRKTVLRLAKSAAAQKCEICGDSQFANGRFVGCQHFSELAKSALSTETAAGYVIELNPEEWDAAAVASLVRAFGGAE